MHSPVARPRLRLGVEVLEDRAVPALVAGTEAYYLQTPRVVVGSGAGGGEVRVYDVDRADGFGPGREALRLTPFGAGFAGGVNVATADLNGDATPEIVAAMASGGSEVKVFDGATGAELRSFEAFDPGYAGGVNVAVGRPGGETDNWAIVVGAAGGGGPHVKVFDVTTGAVERSFFAFDAGFTGGVSVAAGDTDGDGHDDLIVGAGPGGGPHVKVFDGKTGALDRSFFAFESGFTGGVNVAAALRDGAVNIVAGMASRGSAVAEFNGLDGGVFLAPFTAYTGGVGVRVAAADFASGPDTPWFPDIITGPGVGGGPNVKLFGNSPFGSERESFFAFDSGSLGGASVAAAPVRWGFRTVPTVAVAPAAQVPLEAGA